MNLFKRFLDLFKKKEKQQFPLYSKEWFIQKFEAIPTEEIGEGGIYAKCALWHVGVKATIAENTEEALALIELFKPIVLDKKGEISSPRSCIWSINDDDKNTYFEGARPKDRILNALKSI